MSLARFRWARRVLLLTGVALVLGALVRIGPGVIVGHLRALGWGLLLVFLPYLLVAVLDTLGWRYAIQPGASSVSFARLFFARLAGEAVNVTVPAASLGGEPVKAMILGGSRVPLTEALASVVIAKTTMLMSQLPFVLIGLAIAATCAEVSWPFIALMTLVLAAGTVLVTAFFLSQRWGLCAVVLGLLRRLGVRSHFLEAREEELKRLDLRIADFYARSPRRFSLSLLFHFLGWVAGSLEVYVVLQLLGLGGSFATAFAIEALSSAIRAGAFLIPGNVGTQEGGNILLFGAFGLASAAGLTFSLLRRLREITFTGGGLLVLARFGIPLGRSDAA